MTLGKQSVGVVLEEQTESFVLTERNLIDFLRQTTGSVPAFDVNPAEGRYV